MCVLQHFLVSSLGMSYTNFEKPPSLIQPCNAAVVLFSPRLSRPNSVLILSFPVCDTLTLLPVSRHGEAVRAALMGSLSVSGSHRGGYTPSRKKKKNLSGPVFQVGKSGHTQCSLLVFVFSWTTCFTDASGRQNPVTCGHVLNSSAAQKLCSWVPEHKRPILGTFLLFLWLDSQKELVPLPCVDPLTPRLNLWDCQVSPPRTWFWLFRVAFHCEAELMSSGTVNLCLRSINCRVSFHLCCMGDWCGAFHFRSVNGTWVYGFF